MDMTFSYVLLNGVLGKQFMCKRGVRQGDTLSPLLFVLVVDLLQSIQNTSIQHALISQLIVTPHCQDFPVIHYADDTVMIMPAYPFQLEQVKNLLMHYYVYTGLRINFDKSVMVPISTRHEKIQTLWFLSMQSMQFPIYLSGFAFGIDQTKN